MFMVFSDLSGLPIEMPFLSQDAPSGYDAVGSGVILFALVLLMVGMIGLYAQKPGSGGARVIEYGEGYLRYDAADLVEEQFVPEEAHPHPAEEQSKTTTASASRAGVLVAGAGLFLFFLLRH